MTSSLEADYAELVSEILPCEKCGLCRSRTHAVPGDGSLRAELMFVGEGPGKNEDQEGIPFCGASGKFLSELLDSIGLARETVYITNIVKCRPPHNRDPLPEEVTACTPYLDRQIAMIGPKVIATLGRHAMSYFLPGLKISEAHGKAYRRNGQVFVPLYHPAVALYRASMKEELLQDFAIIKKIINQLQKPGSEIQTQLI